MRERWREWSMRRNRRCKEVEEGEKGEGEEKEEKIEEVLIFNDKEGVQRRSNYKDTTYMELYERIVEAMIE